jgi:hypothetical protein
MVEVKVKAGNDRLGEGKLFRLRLNLEITG